MFSSIFDVSIVASPACTSTTTPSLQLDSPFINPRPQPRKNSVTSQNGGDNVFATPQHPQRNGGVNGTSSSDDKNDNKSVDEGLVALRRQPSIRDRRKVLESHISSTYIPLKLSSGKLY